MRQIRRGLFETNSSSTHSLTMCDKETYERWKKGELLFDTEMEKFVKNDGQPVDCKESEYCTYGGYDEYVENMWFESFEQKYTTPRGENVVAFGYYGHD